MRALCLQQSLLAVWPGAGEHGGAYQSLGVVTVGHDDVPVARVGEVLGSVQAEARGGAGDDGGLLAIGCS